MPQDFTDDKSTFVQVMAWCCQATSHYLSQCWPRNMSPYGIIRPQWVNSHLMTWKNMIFFFIPQYIFMQVLRNHGGQDLSPMIISITFFSLSSLSAFDIRVTPTVDLTDFEEKIKTWCNESGPDVVYEFEQVWSWKYLTENWLGVGKYCNTLMG